MQGTAGVTYDVVLRFRGVVEERTYTGGTQAGHWYTGGDAPDRSDPFNIYPLQVSSPAQTYCLNAGTSGIHTCDGLDYTETIEVAAGATVTLTADSVDGGQIIDIDASGNAIVVPGIAPAPNAYDGQFVQMDVVSVTPH